MVLLIIIWGGVFYKYFGKSKSSEKNIEVTNAVSNYEQVYNIAKDTFQLELMERDPFGISGGIKNPIPTEKPVNRPKVVVKPTVNKSIAWPTIIYHGFVKGERKTNPLILLKIDNRLYRKWEGETVNNITLVKAYSDSLIVSLNNNTKTIKKQ